MATHDPDASAPRDSSHEPDDAPVGGAIAWMARNGVAANLLMFLLILGGLLTVPSVKQEVFPAFDLDVVRVTVPYPGASPAEVEQGIALAVEEAVRGVDGVKKVTSVSAEGAGTVTVELLLGANAQKALSDIKNEVDRIQSFPEEAEDPTVSLVTTRQRVVSLVLSGDTTRAALHDLAERGRGELIRRGITQVDVEGIPPLEVSVEVDRATQRSLGLTLPDIAAQIGFASLELPGGGLDTERGEVLVRVSDRARSGEEFADIVLRGTLGGSEVRLGEVAQVTDGFEDNDQASYFNGQPAVLLTAYRVGDETPTGIADIAKAYAKDLRAELPPGMTVAVWSDDSELLRGRIDLLVRNAQMGLVLVVLVLALFLDLRLAFWASLGIPTSFAGAFLLFPAFGVSINMISLFALIITLGIVVDDAIVVGENIYDKLQAGMAPLRAAIEGAREMIVPVTFSILTTFAAFAPLLAVPGTSGKIFRIIPIVVISVLAISLVESFLVLPNHLSHGAPTTGPAAAVLRAAEGTRVFVAAALERFSARVYTPLLHAALSARYLTVAVSSALFMAAAGMAASGLLPFTFLPKVEADTVRVTARLPYGVPIETTEEVRARVEAGLQAALREVGASDEVKGVLTLVGQGPLQFGPGAGARPVGSHLLSVEVDLVPIDARDFTTVALADAWERNLGPIPGLQALSFSYSTGPSGGKAVDVQLAHNDTEVLAAASLEVEEALRAYDDLNNIDNTFAAGKPQLDFSLRPEARGLGLTAAEVARQVRAAFFGAEALREQRGRSELKVMVRLPDAERSSEHDLGALEIRGPAGGWAPLDAVAAATRGQAATEIRRESGRRVVDVTAELKAGVKSARPVLEKLEANVLPALREKYPGLSARFAGEQESQNESFDALGRNYLFALFIIYALLAIPFKSYTQPFVIMAAIPFGFVGAVGGHVLHGFEMSIISVMGIIALSGVVVNDSIVLMDAINGYRRDGLTVAEAVVLAGQRRLRPILLTSLTTFFGLMPMIFEKSVQARFLIPMALSLGYGVLFGTFIALVIVPSLYLILEDVIRLVTARKAVVMPPLPADGAMASVAGSGADVPDDLGLPAP